MVFGSGLRLTAAGIDRWWLWAAAGVAALGLLIVLYRYERRLVPGPTGLALLGLRSLAALLLVVALFEPIAERATTAMVRGRVILGVDLSESMATADPGRPPDRADALARRLGLDPSEDLTKMPRREIARRLLGSGWVDRLEAEHEVEVYGFARGLVEGSMATLSEALATPPKTPAREALATDWGPVLERAFRGPQGEGSEAPAVGVILLTDGLQNRPTPRNPASGRPSERGIPVFPVLVGSTQPPRDAAVAALTAPEAVDRGETARVEVSVKADGLPAGTEVSVKLHRPDGPAMQQTIFAQDDGARPNLTFAVPLESPGENELSVVVGPVAGDIRPDNDRRAVTVVVTDDKARVLAIDGEARWEFQYLRNALRRDPRVAFEAVVFRQPKGPTGAGTVDPAALPSLPDIPSSQEVPPSPDPLGAFDAIIVGDIRPGDLDADAWARLDRYVAGRGGTLVLAAGPAGWPALLEAGGTLGDLLPVRDVRPVPVDPGAIDPARPALPPGAPVMPTPEAIDGPWPMFRLGDDAAASRAAWADLPPSPWVLAGVPKPSATALATAGAPVKSDPAPGATAIAAMPYGLGKVLWIGTDGTWRWRYRLGDAIHHRFWGQVARWALRDQLAAGNRLVRFGAVPPRVAEGEAASIVARFADEAPGLGPDLLAAARIVPAAQEGAGDGDEGAPEDHPVALVPLRPSAERPGVFEGAAPVLPPGIYAVRLEVPAMAGAMAAEGGPPEAPMVVVPGTTSELVELAAAREPLEALADATGGRVLAEHEVDALPGLLAARSVARTRVESIRLGERPELLLAFFALLAAEWALRKRAGLP